MRGRLRRLLRRLGSVYVVGAVDEDGRVRACTVFWRYQPAEEKLQRLRRAWGGANAFLASCHVHFSEEAQARCPQSMSP